MIDEHLNHRRDEQRIGDMETLDRLRHGFRREGLDDRVRTGVQQHVVYMAAPFARWNIGAA